MKYFSRISNLDDLKCEYKRLALENHPDRGGDTATMQEINAEYDEVFERLRDIHEAADDSNSGCTQKRATAETAADFRIIIDILIRMGWIEIELCGRWLWISGNTYAHRAELKAAGCKWASKKTDVVLASGWRDYKQSAIHADGSHPQPLRQRNHWVWMPARRPPRLTPASPFPAANPAGTKKITEKPEA